MSLGSAIRGHPRRPPHDDVWKDDLERKGLSAAVSVLEEYGHMSLLKFMRMYENTGLCHCCLFSGLVDQGRKKGWARIWSRPGAARTILFWSWHSQGPGS
jgi:hypothetical protein